MERSLAVDEPESSVSSQSETVQTPADRDPEVDWSPAGEEEVQIPAGDLDQSNRNDESEFEEITSVEVRTSRDAEGPGPGPGPGPAGTI